MPAPATNGTAVPVGLIADPWAHQLAHASQMGSFDFFDSGSNHFDPRAVLPDPNGNDGDRDYGVNMIILNSLTRPLKLVETQTDQYFTPGTGISGSAGFMTDFDRQVCYPTNPMDGTVHEIPAARPYPIKSKRQRAAGGPAMLAGLGWYRFDMTGHLPLGRALSFQIGDDTTQHVGMLARLDLRSRGPFQLGESFGFGAVTADLEREYVTFDKFFHMKMPNPKKTPWGPTLYSTSAADRGSLAVWCSPIPHAMDRLGTNSVVFWVFDAALAVGG